MKLLTDRSWRRRLQRRGRAEAGRREFALTDALGDYRGITASRYARIAEIDRWRPEPFDMPPPPERDAVHRRVQELIEHLEGAIDEGSGGVLDRQIESWVAAWMAGVESDYADHCGLIQMIRGQAEQWVREITVELEQARVRLGSLSGDYEALGRKLRDSGITAPAALPEDGDDGAGPAPQNGPEPGPKDDVSDAGGKDEPSIEIEFDFNIGGGGGKS